MAAFDVGARGGAKHDLGPLASGINYVLFEPEKEAYDRLVADHDHKTWRSVRCVNTALAAENGSFPLNLYRQRGCSSRFTADAGLGEIFSRGDYYIHDGVVNVPARKLDDLVEEGQVPSPDFMKIDVQGMELEVFSGASVALSRSIVGIRAEVSFFAIYPGQPLFAEIDLYLRQFGFVPMRWLESHEWRRRTRAKFPKIAEDLLPSSRGQMMHADVLYLIHPESLACDTEEEMLRMIHLGLVAACFGHLDHAAAAFSRPGVRELIMDRARIDPINALVPLARPSIYQTFAPRIWRKLSQQFGGL